MTINTLQWILANGRDMDQILCTLYESRASEAFDDSSDPFTLGDWQLVEQRCRAVLTCLPRLEAALRASTEQFTWIAKYRMGGDFGLPLEDTSDPLVSLNRAECLLALWMLLPVCGRGRGW